MGNIITQNKKDKCRAMLSFNLQLNTSVKITDQSANKSQAKLIIIMLLLTVKRIFHLLKIVALVKIDKLTILCARNMSW